jgi:Uncharacterized protein conserved in bacteria (DUF2188)
VRAVNGWRIEIEGSKRAQSTHQRQSDAWDGARQIARRKKTQAYLHARNGRSSRSPKALTTAHAPAQADHREAGSTRRDEARRDEANPISAPRYAIDPSPRVSRQRCPRLRARLGLRHRAVRSRRWDGGEIGLNMQDKPLSAWLPPAQQCLRPEHSHFRRSGQGRESSRSLTTLVPVRSTAIRARHASRRDWSVLESTR